MVSARKIPFLSTLVVIFFLPSVVIYGGETQGAKSPVATTGVAHSGAEKTPEYSSMQRQGAQVPVGNGYYIIYGFDKKPKLGTIIMKVEVFTKEGKKDTSLEVMADSGMPSMKGAHETGEQLFRLSKKGDYLLPISIVMPGDWEVRLTIKKNGKIIFRGSHQFDV